MEVKIIDFGMSKDEEESDTTENRVAYRWCSPEIFDTPGKASYSKASVTSFFSILLFSSQRVLFWAFACTGVELLDGAVPFHRIRDIR